VGWWWRAGSESISGGSGVSQATHGIALAALSESAKACSADSKAVGVSALKNELASMVEWHEKSKAGRKKKALVATKAGENNMA